MLFRSTEEARAMFDRCSAIRRYVVAVYYNVTFPRKLAGTSYDFVLHWNEQVFKYEQLEVDLFPPKHRLRMLQNTVGEVREIAYVKQIGDQDVARGRDPLDYETYIELCCYPHVQPMTRRLYFRARPNVLYMHR